MVTDLSAALRIFSGNPTSKGTYQRLLASLADITLLPVSLSAPQGTGDVSISEHPGGAVSGPNACLCLGREGSCRDITPFLL